MLVYWFATRRCWLFILFIMGHVGSSLKFAVLEVDFDIFSDSVSVKSYCKCMKWNILRIMKPKMASVILAD